MLNTSRKRLRLLLFVVSLVVVVIATACDTSGSTTTTTTTTGGDSEPTSTVVTSTATTLLTSIPTDSIPGETSPSIDPDLASAIRAEIGGLILDAEESRGLPFLRIPIVTILDEADFMERVRSVLEEDLDPVELQGDQAVFELLGMLDGSIDLYDFLVELYTEQVAGFYDADVGELVVPVSVDGVTPLQRVTILHELIHALTDQHFDFNDAYEELVEEGSGDDAYGVLALVEGDATYQQFLFLESMDPADAAKAVIESLSIDSTVYESSPLWIQQDLAFPYEHGLVFTGFLVAEGGLKGVDEAYLNPPISTEQILHPEKYARFEQPSELASLTVALDGWELFDEGTFGEWGIRMLVVGSLRPGEVTQAAAGWGNDHYRSFIRGGDTALAWVYSGETTQDAEDLADALIAHVRGAMNAGSPRESGGGLLFDGGSTYVFIDRVDEMIYFVASTDATAGASLRQQLGV
ncbi:MAG: hypothetical protein V3S38_03320 [Acidimicrobiia bacterium]